jgi:hypothetical protein
MPEYCKPTALEGAELAAPVAKTGVTASTIAAPTAFTPVAAANMPLPCLPEAPAEPE